MTMWKWLGLFLLPYIPLVGSIIYLVLMFKWAFGSTNDLTLKGFARAQLFLMLLLVVAFVGLVVFVIVMGPSTIENLYSQYL